MKREPSTFVCSTCGLPVIRWLDGWKHVGNAYATSCGKPPRLQRRSEYEAELTAVVKYVKGKP